MNVVKMSKPNVFHRLKSKFLHFHNFLFSTEESNIHSTSQTESSGTYFAQDMPTLDLQSLVCANLGG